MIFKKIGNIRHAKTFNFYKFFGQYNNLEMYNKFNYNTFKKRLISLFLIKLQGQDMNFKLISLKGNLTIYQPLKPVIVFLLFDKRTLKS